MNEESAYRTDHSVRHKKSGEIYFFLDFTINATNSADSEDMVLYMNERGLLFVRNTTEFWQKFEELPNDPK